jgi:hypothetical protein
LERVKKACEDMDQETEVQKAFENIRKLDWVFIIFFFKIAFNF